MLWKKLAGFTLAAFMLMAIVFAPANTANAQISFGTNWQARFYNSTDAIFQNPLPNPVYTTTYPNGLNFVWPGQPVDPFGLPITSINADNFSVLFTTTESFITAGTYQFFGQVDDRIIVAVDGVVVYQQDTPGQFAFQYSLQAGVRALTVGLVELTEESVLQFQWQFIGTGAVGTAVPIGPQGRVVNVRGLSLRTGPYLGASFISVLRPDNNYTVLGKSDDEGGGYTWYRVVAGERVGWTSGRYLVVDGQTGLIPTEGNIFQTLDNPNSTGVIGVTRAVMNFRRRPSVRSARIGQIPWGAEVEIYNRTVQAGMDFWYQVRYNDQIGWIYAPFIGIKSGFINTVPVR